MAEALVTTSQTADGQTHGISDDVKTLANAIFNADPGGTTPQTMWDLPHILWVKGTFTYDGGTGGTSPPTVTWTAGDGGDDEITIRNYHSGSFPNFYDNKNGGGTNPLSALTGSVVTDGSGPSFTLQVRGLANKDFTVTLNGNSQPHQDSIQDMDFGNGDTATKVKFGNATFQEVGGGAGGAGVDVAAATALVDALPAAANPTAEINAVKDANSAGERKTKASEAMVKVRQDPAFDAKSDTEKLELGEAVVTMLLDKLSTEPQPTEGADALSAIGEVAADTYQLAVDAVTGLHPFGIMNQAVGDVVVLVSGDYWVDLKQASIYFQLATGQQAILYDVSDKDGSGNPRMYQYERVAENSFTLKRGYDVTDWSAVNGDGILGTELTRGQTTIVGPDAEGWTRHFFVGSGGASGDQSNGPSGDPYVTTMCY